MAGVRGWEDLRAKAAKSELAKLGETICQQYGTDLQDWLDIATTPLPETLRLNPLRYDSKWTETLLLEIGGERIGWYDADGGAFQFPWQRGKPQNDDVKSIMQSLHETGRVTRQEAASMLPILIANPQSGETLLDLCAAPGSKTTQAMVAMKGGGVVVANEVNSKRTNMLSTNITRMGLPNIVMCRHDGRHFPRVPDPGFDVVIADVPCTGTATVRKNSGLWGRWKPTSSTGIQRLQIDIAIRGARLLRPGGRMVYSTCSIDVAENEVVVAEILSNCPWLRLAKIDETRFSDLGLHQGFSDWPILIDYDAEIRDQLVNCRRLPIGGTHNTGGFFVALFEHVGAEEYADAMLYDRTRDMVTRTVPEPNEHTPIPLDENLKGKILDKWPISGDDFSWWKRGKRIYAGTPQLKDWLHDQPRFGGKGRMWPGNNWHPLQVITSGLPILEERSGSLRPKAAAMPILRDALSRGAMNVTSEQFNSWLKGPGPRREELNFDEEKGSVVISYDSPVGQIVVPAWLGELLTPMVDANEILILELQVNP